MHSVRRLALNFMILLFISCSVFALVTGKRLRRGNVITSTEMTAWTGQEIALQCGDKTSEMTQRRFWRKGYEILAVASIVISQDERVNIVNNSNELRISNITMDDEGEYTCVVSKKPIYKHTYALRIRELMCETPTVPDNGGYENETTRDGDENSYRFGDTIRYYCSKGYLLVGAEVRTCGDPYKGWTDETPTCEPEFMARIKHRLDDIESKIREKPAKSDDKAVAKLENKVTTIEGRVSALEGGSNFSSNNQLRINDIDATLHRFRTAINTNIHRSRWEKLLHGDLASLGEKDGYLVSEFTWFIDNIDEKIAQHRAEKFKYLESKPFYTNIPGYRMRLHLYPDYDMSGQMGMYAILVRGEFDTQISWPFTNRYEMSILSRDENDVIYDVVIPSKVPSCNFERPPPDNTIGCGFSQFVSVDAVMGKKDTLLYDGTLAIVKKGRVSDSGPSNKPGPKENIPAPTIPPSRQA